MKTHRAPGKVGLTIAVFSVLMLFASVDARTFTATDGRTIEAEVQEVNSESAVLKRRIGISVTVPLSSLVEADRKFLAEWAKEDQKNRVPRVKVVVDSNKRDSVVRAGYDERRGTFQFKVSISNEERDFKIAKATATLLVLGDDLEEPGLSMVMQRKEFKDIDIEFGKTFELNAPEVRYEYDKNGYTYGEKYSAYIFILKTASGKVIDISGTTTRFENLADIILNLKEGEWCNKQYQKIKEPRMRSSVNFQ